MFCSSNAPRPSSVIVRPPTPFDFTKPNAPSLLAIFIGIGGGSPVPSVAAPLSPSQSKTSPVRFRFITTIPLPTHISLHRKLLPSPCQPLQLEFPALCPFS